MHFPSRIVLDQDASVERTTGKEEDDRDHQVGRQRFLNLLMLAWDLHLGGDCYDDADPDKKPLVLQGREDDVEPLRTLACVGGSCGGGGGVGVLDL